MKYYKAMLSNKESIYLDEQDFEKLMAGMTSGSFVKLKKAIVNPSFVITLLPVSPKEALSSEPNGDGVEGYLDEERRVYVITKDNRPRVQGLRDGFAK